MWVLYFIYNKDELKNKILEGNICIERIFE